MLQLVLALVLVCAPLPAPPPGDPLAQGYIGILMPGQDSLQIGTVLPNTAAERAGLRAGDIIQRVGRVRPVVFNEVREYVKGFRPGTELEVEVKRAGEPLKLTIRLMTRPPNLDATGLPVEP